MKSSLNDSWREATVRSSSLTVLRVVHWSPHRGGTVGRKRGHGGMLAGWASAAEAWRSNKIDDEARVASDGRIGQRCSMTLGTVVAGTSAQTAAECSAQRAYRRRFVAAAGRPPALTLTFRAVLPARSAAPKWDRQARGDADSGLSSQPSRRPTIPSRSREDRA
jgi:hypothetical protein